MDEIENKELLIQRAVFGEEVKQFLSSYIGKYILERASDQIKSAQFEFRHTVVTDTSKLTELQNKINVASNIVDWLSDAINDGMQAIHLLDDRS